MKFRYIIISIFFLTGFCYSQTILPEGVQLKRNTSIYSFENDEITCITYTYYNNCNQKIWLWIEKDDPSNLTDLQKIKRYFIKRKDGADFSLYEYGMDGNIGEYTPRVFESFIKCIPANKDFSIQIISKGHISEDIKQKVFSYFNKRVLVYKEKDMTTSIPYVNQMSQIMFYKEDFIVLYLDMLKL